MKQSQQLIDYAETIVSNPLKDEVIDIVTMKLMRAFKKGSPEIREEAVKTLDSLELFFSELDIIVASNKDLDQ